MRKSYYIPLSAFLLSIACFIGYTAIGAHITPDGTLVEPFALIPIGMAAFVFALISAALSSGVALRKHPKRHDRWIFAGSLVLLGLCVIYFIASVAYLSHSDNGVLMNK